MTCKNLIGNGKVQIMRGSMDSYMGSNDGGLSWIEINRKDIEVVNGEFIIRFAPVVKEAPPVNLNYEDMCDISRQAADLVFTEPVECTGGTLLPSVKPVGDNYESNVFYKKESEENNKEDGTLNSDDYNTLLAVLDSEDALIYYTTGSPLMEYNVVDKLIKCNCLSVSDRGVISITPEGKQIALDYNKRFETVLKSMGVTVDSKSVIIERNVYSIFIPFCNVRYVTYRDGVFTFHIKGEQFDSYGELDDQLLSSNDITPTNILQYLARFIP